MFIVRIMIVLQNDLQVYKIVLKLGLVLIIIL
jgi:hypothetical protein